MANLRIALETIEKIDFLNTSGMTYSEVMARYKPDVLMNLALYDTKSKTTLPHLIDEGKKAGYLFSDEGIGIRNGKEILWAKKEDPSLRDFVAGAPTLLKNGQAYIHWGNKVSDYVNGCHKRTILGFNDTHVILCCTDNALTIEETAETAKSLGMSCAVNLDGGGSQHLQEKEKIYKRSLRANVSWLLIYLKDELKLRQELIPMSNRRSGKHLVPTTLTIHSTGNLKSTAQNERDNLSRSGNTSSASFHVVVDEKEAILCIPFDEVAFHSGTTEGNYSSLSLEICESGNREKTLQNAIQVAAQILNNFGWGADKLRQHYDWNGKNCPAILRNTSRWNWFVSEVKKELEKKNVTETIVYHKGSELKAIIVDGVTYAPVRVLAESLGKIVNYDAKTKTTTII